MRTHRLAKWLLDRKDGEVTLMIDKDDKKMVDFHRKLCIKGMVGEDPTALIIGAELTQEELDEYHKKHNELANNHPGRLLTAAMTFNTDKEKMEAVIKEAKSKGYTILPAHEPDKKLFGFVLYKEIEGGQELAYNPRWNESEGNINI